METLEELKNKYKKLQEESNNLHSKIKALERREAISKFTVGDCYLDTIWNRLIKIVSIKDNYIYYIRLDEASITRDNFYIYDIENWKKILLQLKKNKEEQKEKGSNALKLAKNLYNSEIVAMQIFNNL